MASSFAQLRIPNPQYSSQSLSDYLAELSPEQRIMLEENPTALPYYLPFRNPYVGAIVDLDKARCCHKEEKELIKKHPQHAKSLSSGIIDAQPPYLDESTKNFLYQCFQEEKHAKYASQLTAAARVFYQEEKEQPLDTTMKEILLRHPKHAVSYVKAYLSLKRYGCLNEKTMALLDEHLEDLSKTKIASQQSHCEDIALAIAHLSRANLLEQFIEHPQEKIIFYQYPSSAIEQALRFIKKHNEAKLIEENKAFIAKISAHSPFSNADAVILQLHEAKCFTEETKAIIERHPQHTDSLRSGILSAQRLNESTKSFLYECFQEEKYAKEARTLAIAAAEFSQEEKGQPLDTTLKERLLRHPADAILFTTAFICLKKAGCLNEQTIAILDRELVRCRETLASTIVELRAANLMEQFFEQYETSIQQFPQHIKKFATAFVTLQKDKTTRTQRSTPSPIPLQDYKVFEDEIIGYTKQYPEHAPHIVSRFIALHERNLYDTYHKDLIMRDPTRIMHIEKIVNGFCRFHEREVKSAVSTPEGKVTQLSLLSHESKEHVAAHPADATIVANAHISLHMAGLFNRECMGYLEQLPNPSLSIELAHIIVALHKAQIPSTYLTLIFENNNFNYFKDIYYAIRQLERKGKLTLDTYRYAIENVPKNGSGQREYVAACEHQYALSSKTNTTVLTPLLNQPGTKSIWESSSSSSTRNASESSSSTSISSSSTTTEEHAPKSKPG